MKVNEIVGHCLKREGVGLLTGFPYNQVIDSCAGLGIRPVIARSERVAVNMADGYSRMNAGQDYGVCAVQYGPGIENSVGGLAQAHADAVPILMIPGGYDSHWAGTHPNFSASHSLRTVSKEVMSVNYPGRAASEQEQSILHLPRSQTSSTGTHLFSIHASRVAKSSR